LLDGFAAPGRAHEVNHKSYRPQSIKYKSDQSTQQSAAAVGGFGHTHHEHDIEPGDNDQIHKTLGFVRNSKAKNTILKAVIKRLSKTSTTQETR
jgi:hypothetical protein